mgnify:CR=1 FL=1
MDSLPLGKIPLANLSLEEMEIWLRSIGAERTKDDSSLWILIKPLWTAKIKMAKDGLEVLWTKDQKESQMMFCSYGLARNDIEEVILYGP